jgi:hypothetical protein
MELYKSDKLICLFSKKEQCYFKMIDKYFRQECSKDLFEKMINIINGDSDISLRILDWVVTRYSKKIHLNCQELELKIQNSKNMHNNNLDKYSFDIHISYKAQLKSFKKKHFDPFRRNQKKKFVYVIQFNGKQLSIVTTIGQLNFFRWAIKNNIITYVENNIVKIISDMNKSNREDKNKRNEKKTKLDTDSIENTSESYDNSNNSLDDDLDHVVIYFN